MSKRVCSCHFSSETQGAKGTGLCPQSDKRIKSASQAPLSSLVGEERREGPLRCPGSSPPESTLNPSSSPPLPSLLFLHFNKHFLSVYEVRGLTLGDVWKEGTQQLTDSGVSLGRICTHELQRAELCRELTVQPTEACHGQVHVVGASCEDARQVQQGIRDAAVGDM